MESRGLEPSTWAVLREFVPSDGTAWQYTINALDRYYEHALAKGVEVQQLVVPCENVLQCAREELPALVRDLTGFYLPWARLLGARTAELHRALASDEEDPAFAPEAFTEFYQRSQYQSLRALRARTLQSLRARLRDLPPDAQQAGRRLLDVENEVRVRLRVMRDQGLRSSRIRVHGDFRLGQVLHTGKDFVFTDFEGSPTSPLSERRGKHSALRDVAAMLRSFHNASYTSMLTGAEGPLPANRAALDPWRRYWQAWVPGVFLRSYLDAARKQAFLPSDEEELRALLDIYLLEAALGELADALDRWPERAQLPLEAILQIVQPAGFVTFTVHGPSADASATSPPSNPEVQHAYAAVAPKESVTFTAACDFSTRRDIVARTATARRRNVVSRGFAARLPGGDNSIQTEADTVGGDPFVEGEGATETD